MLRKEERFIERFEKPRRQGRAGAVARQEARQDREARAAAAGACSCPSSSRTPPRSGNDVATLAGVSKRYGARVVYEGFDFEIKRGERWCVIGVNGAGKSTLLKLVAGVLAPDAGEVRLGASLKLGYFAQSALEILDPRSTVWEQIDQAFPPASIAVEAQPARRLRLPRRRHRQAASACSRAASARAWCWRSMLFDPPNFLVLDEPTNHLDLDDQGDAGGARSRASTGTMLFVSHDRTFLRGLATRVLDLSGGGEGIAPRPLVFHGDYQRWVEHTGHEAPGVHR